MRPQITTNLSRTFHSLAILNGKSCYYYCKHSPTTLLSASSITSVVVHRQENSSFVSSLTSAMHPKDYTGASKCCLRASSTSAADRKSKSASETPTSQTEESEGVETEDKSHPAAAFSPNQFEAWDLRPMDFNPEVKFASEPVQKLLLRLCQTNVHKVFSANTFGSPWERPLYKLATTEEVKKMEQEAFENSKERLQVPPFKLARSSKAVIISEDPEIAQFDSNRFIFTDTSTSVKRKDRIVTIRDTNGSLREATHDERDRMLRFWFPEPNRFVTVPPAFSEPQLSETLKMRNNHRYMLDFATVQFEPSDPEYIRVTVSIIKDLYRKRNHECLHGTRHFGTYVFYLCLSNRLDKLMVWSLTNGRMNEAASFVELYLLVYSKEIASTETDEQLITAYISKFAEAANKVELREALETAKEVEQEKQEKAKESTDIFKSAPSSKSSPPERKTYADRRSEIREANRRRNEDKRNAYSF